MTNNGKSPWDPKDQPPDLDQIVEEWQKKFNTRSLAEVENPMAVQ